MIAGAKIILFNACFNETCQSSHKTQNSMTTIDLDLEKLQWMSHFWEFKSITLYSPLYFTHTAGQLTPVRIATALKIIAKKYVSHENGLRILPPNLIQCWMLMLSSVNKLGGVGPTLIGGLGRGPKAWGKSTKWLQYTVLCRSVPTWFV